MAVRIELVNKSTGISKEAYIGFSWTALLFGFWPSVFRGDWIGALIYIALCIAAGAFTLGIGSIAVWIIWPFFYNKWHARRLISEGYKVTAAAGMSVQKANAMLNVH